MEIINTTNNQKINLKPVLFGAALGLALVLAFLSGTGTPNPAWGKFWYIRPLIIVPLAGVGAGLFFHFLKPMRLTGGWIMVLAMFLGVVAYVVAMWLGFVLGFAGTYWN